MFKILIALVFIFSSALANAEQYLEIKTETSYKGFSRGDTTTHVRLGSEKTLTRGKIYIEAGHMSDGHSFEAGYKYKWDNRLVIKGKYEGKKVNQTKSKLETEIRYTF